MKVSGFRIAVLTALACGCGITVAGSLDVIAPGPDAGSETGAALPEAGPQPDAPSGVDSGETVIDIVPVDAAVDANPVNCENVCDGGTCDGGWCTFACGPSQCLNSKVVCPPGVPCAVACNAPGSCNAGVDCTAASACDIQCKGDGTCANAKVACSGAACTVRCSGKGTCNNGLQCDAGDCQLACSGLGSCINQRIDCHADVCNIVCGAGGDKGEGSCNNGVSCTASESCNIVCQDKDTCINGRDTAVSGGTADIRCTGAGSCNNGIFVEAPDSGMFCKNTSCGQGMFCDGGTCKGRCDGKDVNFCCKAGTCAKGTNNCNLTMNNCP